jgi:TnsA-like endonuclease N terminal/NUMOD3 motif
MALEKIVERKRYGALIALRSLGRGRWEFLCDCGKVKDIKSSHVQLGGTLSCGCQKKQRISTSRKKNWQDPEYAKKQAEAIGRGMLGEKNPFYGKTHSEETKAKIAQVQRSREHHPCPEHSERMRKLWEEGIAFNKEKAGKRFSEMNRKNHEDPNFRFRAYGRGWGNSGHHDSTKAGTVQYRSSWELAAYRILDEDHSVKSYIVEPFGVPYKFEGRDRNYYPDILIKYDNGFKKIIEVKPKIELQTPIIIAKIKALEVLCGELGIEFEIWTEDKIKPNKEK